MALRLEVLLCTYNGARFVIEQLQSILRQKVMVDKVSIYDDRSSDDTVSLIKDFVSALPPDGRPHITIDVNERNCGYAGNFANAISKATGDVLFLSDQDDIWEDNKVQVLLRLLEVQPADLAFSDGSLIDQAGAPYGSRTVLQSYGLTAEHVLQFHDQAFNLLIKRNYINGAAVAVRRDAAQSALPLPSEMPHDYWLAIWCALHGGIAVTPELLYRYRLHDGNTIGMGSGVLLYELVGVWRHARTSRARDLRIWQAITHRIKHHTSNQYVDSALRKLDWLASVTADASPIRRASAILRSAVNGSYRRFSYQYSLLRDIVSLIQTISKKSRPA